MDAMTEIDEPRPRLLLYREWRTCRGCWVEKHSMAIPLTAFDMLKNQK
jgi:hypothetical protein